MEMSVTKRALAKVAAAFVAAAMALAMSLPLGTGMAHAADQLPDLSRKCSITVHKRAITPDLQGKLTHQDNGSILSDNTVIGQINGQNVTLGSLTKLEDVEFEVTQVEYNQSKKQWEPKSGGYNKTIKTDSNGDARTGKELPAGMYKVHELPNSKVAAPVADFILQLPMEDKVNGGWLYDVDVYPKNVVDNGPTIEKSVTEAGNMDDTNHNKKKVKWVVTVSIPSDIANAQRFKVIDNINKYLELDLNDEITATFFDSNGSPQTLRWSNRDFVATKTGFSGTGGGYIWSDQLELDFANALGQLGSAYPVSSKYPGGIPTLEIVFETTINIPDQDLPSVMGKDINNRASLDFINNAGTQYEPESEMPEVHVGGVVLLKVDADGKPIIAKDNSGKNIPNGARFGIYETEADAKAGKNLIMEAAADKDGYVKFFGLAYGNKGDNTANSSKEYWVVELDAPTGYNKLNAPFKVTVTATTHDVSFAQKVVNHKFDLPHTGGTGTALLVIGGSAMAAVSIALIVMMRRRDKKAAADKASQA